MSIERFRNNYELQCDYCSNCVDDFEDFQETETKNLIKLKDVKVKVEE